MRTPVPVARGPGVVVRHVQDVPQAAGFVLETAIALGEGDQAVPDGAGDCDGDGEAGFSGGCADVDENAVGDRLLAGVDGEDRSEGVGGAGRGHGVILSRVRAANGPACKSRRRQGRGRPCSWRGREGWNAGRRRMWQGAGGAGIAGSRVGAGMLFADDAVAVAVVHEAVGGVIAVDRSDPVAAGFGACDTPVAVVVVALEHCLPGRGGGRRPGCRTGVGSPVLFRGAELHLGRSANAEHAVEGGGFPAVYCEPVFPLDGDDAGGEPAAVVGWEPGRRVVGALAAGAAAVHHGGREGEVDEIGGETAALGGRGGAETAVMGFGDGDNVLDKCCADDYVAESMVAMAQSRRPSDHRNIIFSSHNDFRKAISPLSFFHGRLESDPEASQSANAFAFISRSISV